MKKIFFALVALFTISFANAQDLQPVPVAPNGCCGELNLVKNSNFESGGAIGGDQINNATDWSAVFCGASSADYWGFSSNATNPVDQPTVSNGVHGKRWAGMWLRKNCSQSAYREGLKGKLSQPIAPNSGKYCITLDLAKDPAHSGTGRLLVYGYKGNLNCITNTTANCSQGNGQILSGAANLKLLAVFSTNTLTNTMSNMPVRYFDSSTLTGDIDGIIITRGDETTGMQYIFIDNVEIRGYSVPCNR